MYEDFRKNPKSKVILYLRVNYKRADGGDIHSTSDLLVMTNSEVGLSALVLTNSTISISAEIPNLIITERILNFDINSIPPNRIKR